MIDCQCMVCGDDFKAKHKDAIYCNSICRNKSRYKLHKTKYREKSIRVYGITGEDYERLLEEQDFVCAICGEEEKIINPQTNYPYPLCIDHNHNTGEVRGLLCRHCNLVLGQVEKKPNIVKSCLTYLENIAEIKRLRGV